MDEGRAYNSTFFETQREASLRSAKIVVPLVSELVQPRAVVDVGCGVGTWLSLFKDYGADRILGIDGAYVDSSSLLIPGDCFRAVDLNRPVALDEKFDLAVCLEVAEHISKTSAEGLIRFLVNLAPVILFSAAVPMQGGTHHINEQWPAYWAALFRRFGYTRIDAVRKLIWKNPQVAWWYRQNVFLFVREDSISSYAGLNEARSETDDLVLVHREILERYLWLPEIIKRLPARIWEAVIRRICGTNGKVYP
jgi:SAM-dependent methyltransferase